MVVLERQFRALTEQTELVSGVPPLSPEEVGQAVAVAISLWDATKRFLADMPPAERTKRESVRSALSLLRSAEHTIATTRDSVALLAKQGLRIRERGRLEDALEEVRAELLMPTARMMARHDPDGRTPEQLRDFMLPRVEFRLGRPVITPELAADLPCPFDPEPVA